MFASHRRRRWVGRRGSGRSRAAGPPGGDHTSTVAYRPLQQLVPAPPPATGSGTTSSNRPRHHQRAPERVRSLSSRVVVERRVRSCAVPPCGHVRPSAISPGGPSAERRRRWSHRTRARAQAACHRHPSPTRCLVRGLGRWRAACAERAEGGQRWRRDGARPHEPTSSSDGTRPPLPWPKTVPLSRGWCGRCQTRVLGCAQLMEEV